jgi:hypothetical protein
MSANLNCDYCYEIFDDDQFIRYKLDCGHYLCLSCIKYLKRKKFFRCPMERVPIDFDKILSGPSLMQYFCRTHGKEIIEICESHLEALCCSCKSAHRECDRIQGDFDSLNKRIDEMITFHISITDKQRYLYDEHTLQEYLDKIASIEETIKDLAAKLLKTPDKYIFDTLSINEQIKIVKILEAAKAIKFLQDNQEYVL